MKSIRSSEREKNTKSSKSIPIPYNICILFSEQINSPHIERVQIAILLLKISSVNALIK